MPHTVFVRQFEGSFSAEDDEPILDAALRNDLDYPFGCHSGNCGSCKSVLLSGEVHLREHSEFALTEEEEAQGFILACQAVPQSNVEVAFIDPDEPAEHDRREMAGKVTEVERLTHDIQHVTVAIEGEAFQFSPGQYSEVTFPDQPARDYSMASAPGKTEIEFFIRKEEDGLVSQFVYDDLKPGDQLSIKGPFGVSYLRIQHRGPIWAAAGGSGLAPIKSILDDALARGMAQPISLYFGVRTEDDLYLSDYFEAQARAHGNFTFVPVLSEPEGDTEHRTGFLADVMAEDVAAKGQSLDGSKAYLAGPPIMVETIVEVLTGNGLDREHCHADAFYSDAEMADKR